MKNLSASLLALLAAPTATLAQFWRVTRTDSQVFGWTDHDQNIVIDGVTYRASEGMQPTASHSTDTLAPDSIDVTVFLDVSTEEEIIAGIWDDAQVVHFECNWASPPTAIGTDTLIMRTGNVGDIRRQDSVLVAEVQGLTRRLSRRIGRQYSPTCPWRLGDSRCTLNISSYTHTGTISSVGSDPRLEFLDATQAQSASYFNEGELTFTSGQNAGVKRVVRAWQNARFSLYLPLPFAAQIGDTYSAVRGDDKTFSTCQLVFNNVVNFGGFPHIPGQDAVYSNPAGL